MLYGGTFDSAYILTITALPSQLAPTTNKRNAALLQAFMADALGVAPVRGVVKFVGIPDADLAFNGTTVLGQIENLQTASDSVAHSKQSSVVGTAPSTFHSGANSAAYAPPPPPDSAPSHLPPDPPSYPPPTPIAGPPPTLAPAPNGLRKRQNSQRDPCQYRFTPKKLPLRDGSQSLPLSRAASPGFDSRPSLGGGADRYYSDEGVIPPMPGFPRLNALDRRAERMQSQRIGKRKSFWGVFGRRRGGSVSGMS